MNSKLLSFLEEIKAQGNMSKAAQALFVTQPYISRVIKNAEVNFGVKLIDSIITSHPIDLRRRTATCFLTRRKSAEGQSGP